MLDINVMAQQMEHFDDQEIAIFVAQRRFFQDMPGGTWNSLGFMALPNYPKLTRV